MSFFHRLKKESFENFFKRFKKNNEKKYQICKKEKKKILIKIK
ncbi:hypothetical protein [Candidatus Carsonella ruddii]